MDVLTKTAADVYAPFNADGTPRSPSLGDAVTYHTEIERGLGRVPDLVAGEVESAAEQFQQETTALENKIDVNEATLNSKIDSTKAALETQIEGIAVSGDIVTKATWAQLLATPGTRAGQRGLVEADTGNHTDPVVGGSVPNQGIYTWSGAGWQWLRTDDYKGVSRRAGAPLALQKPIIIDVANMLGGGAAIYVPTSMTYRNASDGTIFSAALSSDSKLDGWHKVPVNQTGALQTVYYDRTDGKVKSVQSGTAEIPLDVDKYFHLISVWGSASGSGSGYTSIYAVESTVNQGAIVAGCRNNAVVFDQMANKLYLPAIYGYYKGDATWSLIPPSGNTGFREIDLPASEMYHVWVDTFDVAKNGSGSSTAIKITQGFSSTPQASHTGQGGLVLLGSGYGRWFAPAAGLNLATVVPNEFACGREDNDFAKRVRAGSVPVDLTEPASLALGFKRGYRDTSPVNGRVYYGGYFKQARNSGIIFYRYYLEADEAGQFGTPNAYLFNRNEDGSEGLSVRSPVLAKEHSAKVREYLGISSLVSGATYTGLWVGAHETDKKVKVFGLQFACVPDNNAWVSINDYPRCQDDVGRQIRELTSINGDLLPIDAVIPSDLWMIEERRYPLYIDQLTKHPAEGGRLRASRMRVATANTDINEIEQVTGGTLRFTENNQDHVRVVLHDKADQLSRHYMRDVRLHVASQADIASLSTISMHCIGDSLTNTNGASVNTIRRMLALGAAVSPFGGREMRSIVTGDDKLAGEGRSGIEFADFIYEKTDVVSPTTPAAYTAASDTAKAALNPYLRAATGSDPATLVNNGYVFDFRYYLDNYGYPDPDVVLLNMGTNDMSRNDAATSKLRLQRGLDIMVSQIRAACPQALIVLPFNPYGRAATEGRWTGNLWDGLKLFTEFLRQKADDKIILLPAYCGVQRDIGFQNSTEIDPATGMVTALSSDATHYSEAGVRQFGEMAAQTILAKLILA